MLTKKHLACRSVKNCSQAAVSRRRRMAQCPAPSHLRLHDFVCRKKEKLKPVPHVNLKVSKTVSWFFKVSETVRSHSWLSNFLEVCFLLPPSPSPKMILKCWLWLSHTNSSQKATSIGKIICLSVQKPPTPPHSNYERCQVSWLWDWYRELS